MNLEGAIRGARNPMNSWNRSDSRYDSDGNYILGENDLGLAIRLCRAGSDHRKFIRQILVSVDITAPLYWWKEFDTYKVATVANSTSTMHKIHSKPFEADDFSNDAKTDFAPVDQIPDGWEGLDIGPKTEAIYADVIKNSKTILWNGPTGVFEFENFTHGSRTVGEAIVEATKNGAFSLVGGGDSVACVNKFGLANGVSYVSTGGGALLEAIEGKVLPGIAAVKGEAYK